MFDATVTYLLSNIGSFFLGPVFSLHLNTLFIVLLPALLILRNNYQSLVIRLSRCYVCLLSSLQENEAP